MKIINLTPHEVKLVDDKGAVKKVFPESGKFIRLVENTSIIEKMEYDGVTIPYTRTTMGAADYLPPEVPGVQYIVSRSVAEALRRNDLVFPNQILRNGSGNIVGCRSFGFI